MPFPLTNAQLTSASVPPTLNGDALVQSSTKNAKSPRAPRRVVVTDRMVESVMALTIVALEQQHVPAQGEGNILHVYAEDHEITHDVRRALVVFEGDMHEAIESILAFVTEGIMGDAPAA